MRVRSEQGGAMLAWGLAGLLAVAWLANWFTAPASAISCAGAATPDCGVVVRDRP